MITTSALQLEVAENKHMPSAYRFEQQSEKDAAYIRQKHDRLTFYPYFCPSQNSDNP